MIHRTLAALALALLPSLALAQAVPLQAGPTTPGHAPMYSGAGGLLGQPVIQDSGPAGGGQAGIGLSEQLLVARGPGSGPGGTNWCDYDGPITGPYHYLCLSAQSGGGALIATGAGNGAAPAPLTMSINGTNYQFPFVLSGIVGPSTSAIGDLAVFGNGIGTLLSDPSLTGAPVKLNAPLAMTLPQPPLNTTLDVVRVAVGNMPPSGQYGSLAPVQTAITGLINVPTGAYSAAGTGQDGDPWSALAGYVNNQNPDVSGVGLYILSGTTVDNAFGQYGANIVVTNAEGYTATAHEFQREFGIEMDAVVYCKGALVNGACPTALQPHGLVKGIISELNADTSSLGGPMVAFETVGSVNFAGRQDHPWDIAYASDNGGAVRGISLGAVTNTAPSNSQDIIMEALNSAGAPLLGQFYEDSGGNFNIINQASGVTLQMASSYPQLKHIQSAAGGPSGMNLLNLGSTAGTTENLTLQVGSGNYASLQVGVTTPGLIVATSTGNIALNPGGTGYGVNVNGTMAVSGAVTAQTNLSVLGSLIQPSSNAPASGTSPCTIGQEAWDGGYEYRCVATNQWVRSAHASF